MKVLEQDQQAGRQVQMRMLPATPLVLDDYVISHTVIPSLYLSGDFTDYFTVGENFVTFFMADVSGHGSSSAFATVLLKNLFARKRSDFLRRYDDSVLSPVAMLKRANKELLDLGCGKFATMVVGLLDMARQYAALQCGGASAPAGAGVSRGCALPCAARALRWASWRMPMYRGAPDRTAGQLSCWPCFPTASSRYCRPKT